MRTMKFFLLPIAFAAVANAALDSCASQKDCIEFTHELLNTTTCPEENGTCEYLICAKMSFTGDCAISGKGAKMSMSCEKPDDTCSDDGLMPFSNPLVSKVNALEDGYMQCQIVTGGMLAEFVFNDGGKCDGTAFDGYNLGSITANCEASSGATCTGVKDGCVWKALAPACPDWDVRKATKPNPNSLSTCELQNNCIDFSITEITDTPAGCDDGKEYYQVCAQLDFSKDGCSKDVRDIVSHTCVGGEECGVQDSFLSNGFEKFEELGSIKDGYKECQTVQAGSSAHFLFKDAQSCSLGSSYSDPVTGALCQPRGEETPSCTGNDVGQECVWEIPVPEPSPPAATASPTDKPTEPQAKVQATPAPTEKPTDAKVVETPSPTEKPTEAKVVETPSPTEKVDDIATPAPTPTEFARPGIPRSGECMQSVYDEANGSGELVCSANMVSLDSVSAATTMTCVEGDKVSIDVTGTVHMSDTLYDFGWYIAADAGDGLTGTCYTGFLEQGADYSVTNGMVSCDSDASGTADECCDVTMNGGGGSLDDLSLSSGGTIEVTCADIDSDGFLDFSICFTWRDASSDDACNSSSLYPGGSTVCDCATYSIEQVTVTKATTTHSTCI